MSFVSNIFVHIFLSREEYLFSVFEAIISTLESKLQRIENLDKAVEHLMRRVEGLDSRVNDNIGKTESIIAKLGNLDIKLFQSPSANDEPRPFSLRSDENKEKLNDRLISLDIKVEKIDRKLNNLKNQLDNNNLPGEDINAEASEKKPVSMNVVEITKALNSEVMNHISKELNQLRTVTTNVDRKLQFHINLVSDNLGKVVRMMSEVHEAVVEPEEANDAGGGIFWNNKTTTTMPTTPPPSIVRNSKIDALVKQMRPIMTVSEKMDEVWDVVTGTKSSVDNLLPKTGELLIHTQRQERAIGEIHNDLRVKTNKIIQNLDMVERRLKKQEDNVATLAQRPVPAELLLDPTIDRLVEFDASRYTSEDYTHDQLTETTTPIATFTTLPPSLSPTPSPSTLLIINQTMYSSIASPAQQATSTSSEKRSEKRKGGIIFPSVKNKPSPPNTTFTTDMITNIKDVRGYSCVDFLNGGMKDSGVYYLQIRGTTYWFLKVYCEQEIADGGWTVSLFL
ncbi:uncharacterized protein LOC112906379 isoform X1 [Agrilus planipennis]|uniref:Uncharacterized protein LOC112906379 isoform X1 n=1 Tax=Agrilus planipennis TaxID=224129 RepID=A0A7F5RJV8_AGRPL|nr:uncharacterized protein LOC112906379 isoform X1 [Agrilus planipennis]